MIDETPETQGREWDVGRLLLALSLETLTLPVWVVFENRKMRICAENRVGIMQGLMLAIELGQLSTGEGTDDEG